MFSRDISVSDQVCQCCGGDFHILLEWRPSDLVLSAYRAECPQCNGHAGIAVFESKLVTKCNACDLVIEQ